MRPALSTVSAEPLDAVFGFLAVPTYVVELIMVDQNGL